MKLTADKYERRLLHYRQQRSSERLATGIFGKWAWHLQVERDFQRELKTLGIEWRQKQVAQSSARAGSLKALFEKERAL